MNKKDFGRCGQEGEKKNRQHFWMCFVDEGEASVHKHYSLADARNEAARLAHWSGKDVFVLDASEYVRYTPPVLPSVYEWKVTVDLY